MTGPWTLMLNMVPRFGLSSPRASAPPPTPGASFVVAAAERERDALAAKLEHLDGLQQSTDSFDPVQWLADISELLSTLPTAFAVAVDPEGARRILRECLP